MTIFRKIVTCMSMLCLCITVIQPLRAQESSSDAAATGLSKAFNPAISVNALFYGMDSSKCESIWHEEGLGNGFHLQELCVEMSANVDIYLKAQVALSAEEGGSLEVEEAYVTSLRMPIPMTIRAGKMFSTFGQHNLYHAHHMHFAESPLILEQVFGDKLCEIGLEASYLIPLPWYMDLTAGLMNGDNPYLFNNDEKNDLAYLLHLDNLWDLTEEFTLRFGSSYLTGKRFSSEDQSSDGNGTNDVFSEVWGLDIQLKWSPLQYGRYRSLVFQGEYVEASLDIDDYQTKPLKGFFSQILWKFNLKWWLQGRYGWIDQPEELNDFFPTIVSDDSANSEDSFTGERYSFALAYVPTEFSAYRLQYNVYNLGDETEYQIVGQFNITIGSHPAHKY